jgi:Ca2+/Na+ antiporter
MFFNTSTWFTLCLSLLLVVLSSLYLYFTYKRRKTEAAAAASSTKTQHKEESTTPSFSAKSEAEMEVGKDFFASQVEREQLIADKTSVFFSDRVRRPLSKKNLDYSPEETEQEEEQRKKQLDYIHSLLRKQEEENLKQNTNTTSVGGGCPYMKKQQTNPANLLAESLDEYKFSVLNEDGVYEEVPNANNFRDKFTSQMRLYGL